MTHAPPPSLPVRRRYDGVRPFVLDLGGAAGALVSRPRRFLPRGFRKRLMLVVTAVNRCRYCAWAHGRSAVGAGLPPDEVRRLLAGEVVDTPERELPALLYARAWASADGAPGPAAAGALEQAYDPATVRAIHAVLRLIRFGNLAGNTWDHLLFRLTGGRAGR
jgi:AhpD family alkylhydroperoxidase